MEFEFYNNVPIYMQIAKAIKVKIISGEYEPGERLKSVRDLSVALKANPNTVQRALADLEAQKLIYTERTNGKFVTTNTARIQSQKAKYAEALARDYLNQINKIGLSGREAVELIKNTEVKVN